MEKNFAGSYKWQSSGEHTFFVLLTYIEINSGGSPYTVEVCRAPVLLIVFLKSKTHQLNFQGRNTVFRK